MAEPKIHKILIVDDDESSIFMATKVFAKAKETNFRDWHILDSQVVDILKSFEFETLLNKEKGDLGYAIDRLWQMNPPDGIISDYHMPISKGYSNAARTDEHHGDDMFFNHPDAIDVTQGGLELVKWAKIAHIPVVMHSNTPGDAVRSLAHKRLKHLKPAKDVPVYAKIEYPRIFVALANQIIAQEKAISAER